MLFFSKYILPTKLSGSARGIRSTSNTELTRQIETPLRRSYSPIQADSNAQTAISHIRPKNPPVHLFPPTNKANATPTSTTTAVTPANMNLGAKTFHAIKCRLKVAVLVAVPTRTELK